MSSLRVVVTGATGLLGGNLAELLVEGGHRVAATRRHRSRVDHLAHLDLEWVDASLDDAASLRRAFRGADAVFHCAAMASLLPRETPALVQANVTGTAAVLASVGSARLVHCSSTVAVGLAEGEAPCDEEAPWNLPAFGLDDGYARTKRRAEELVMAACRRGADAVVVNPTYMFGPYDVRPSSGQMIAAVAKGQALACPTGVNDFVGARDVARGMIAAMERGVAGRRYILSGYGMTYREIFMLIASIVGRSPPRFQLEPRWATPVGKVGDLYQALTEREAPITTTTLRWAATTRYRFAHARATAELGYAPGPIEPAIREAWAWMQAQRRKI